MRLLTLNCQRGFHSKLISRLRDFFKNAFDTEKYDLFLLQEVDAKVLPLLHHPLYKIVRIFDEEAEKESELCIVHRHSYTVRNVVFKSFAPLRYQKHKNGFKCPTFGALWADIDTGKRVIRFVSLHLHSDVNPGLRLHELQMVKDMLSAEKASPTLIGGDFNFIFPDEAAKGAQILAPEFEWMTKEWMPTLNSRYCDNGPSLLTRVSFFLGRFNIGLCFHADHFFMNKALTQVYDSEFRILPDRVSDHSPVEVLLKIKL